MVSLVFPRAPIAYATPGETTRLSHPSTGEASPYYFFHPAAVDRAAALMSPEARIIAQLRDPVIRTYSHWKERRRQDAEPLDFLSALDAEPERLGGRTGTVDRRPPLFQLCLGAAELRNPERVRRSTSTLGAAFGRDRVHVTFSEDYFGARTHPSHRWDPRFLGLPAQPPHEPSHRNAARGEDLDAPTLRRLRAGSTSTTMRWAPCLHVEPAVVTRPLGARRQLPGRRKFTPPCEGQISPS